MVGITTGTISTYQTSGASNEAAPSFSAVIDVGCTCVVVTETNGHNGGVNVTGITCGGNAMTKQVDSGSVGQLRNTIWTLANPPTGSQTIVITAAASGQWVIGVIPLLGSATSPEATASVTATNTTTITSLTNNAILIGVYGQYVGTIGTQTNGDSLFNVLTGDSNTNAASSWVINGQASTQSVGFAANSPTNQALALISVAPADSSDLAVSPDTSVDAGLSSGADLSYSITCSGTNIVLLIGIFNVGALQTVGNVTVDGNSATLLGSKTFVAAGAVLSYYYYLLANSTGSHSIVAFCPETSVRSIAISTNGGNAVNGLQSATSTGTSINSNVTSTRDNMVVDFTFNSNSTLTQNATQTGVTTTAPLKSSRKIGATAVAMSWALGASGNTIQVAANIVAGVQSQILKVSGVARASISKVSGLALASIHKVSGVTNI